MKLSLCLAVYNEEKNIHYPLDSCIDLVDEVVVVDGGSKDKTVAIAKSYGEKVKVFVHKNPKMFHINKQKALDYASGDWILQLDADERLSTELVKEIKRVINMSQEDIEERQKKLPERKLFLRHQLLTYPRRPSPIGKNYSAFFIPRLNYFLGKFLRYGGLYPDGSVRLIKKGKARFPCRDVHEVMEVDGKVGWLQNPILHYDSPTFKRYIKRNNRYINLMVDEFKENKLEKNLMNLMNFLLYKPIIWFLMTTIRHKGILDGWRGIVFSFFSALRFPRAYIRYLFS